MIPNTNYGNLKDSYLFYNIAQKTKAYLEENPGKHLLRMGIGDVSQPLCPAVIEALKKGVEDQAHIGTFNGYMPECGAPFLRQAIADHYAKRGIQLETDEVFVSSGASDELGDILDLFGRGKTVLIPEPAYPAYVDANIMAGNTIVHLPSGRENCFLPEPPAGDSGIDVIYLCSPNNPTGAVFNREKLRKWVDFANSTQAVILFDAAYEAFIEELVEERPAVHSSGAFRPDIRRVFSAREPHARLIERAHDHFGVALVYRESFVNLLLPFVGKNSSGSALKDI